MLILAGINQKRTDCSDKFRGTWDFCWGHLPIYCYTLLLLDSFTVLFSRHLSYSIPEVAPSFNPFLPADIAAFSKQCKGLPTRVVHTTLHSQSTAETVRLDSVFFADSEDFGCLEDRQDILQLKWRRLLQSFRVDVHNFPTKHMVP